MTFYAKPTNRPLALEGWFEKPKNRLFGHVRVKTIIMVFRVMMLNVTFNNSSSISWRRVLLVEDTRVSRENHRPAAGH
jgi:hypothetical protein